MRLIIIIKQKMCKAEYTVMYKNKKIKVNAATESDNFSASDSITNFLQKRMLIQNDF